jgi:hypothetical protein
MKKQLTEIRLSIDQCQQGLEYYLNNHMLREPVQVDRVEWIAKDNQFRIVLKESEDE